jgi:hypothetical protein
MVDEAHRISERLREVLRGVNSVLTALGDTVLDVEAMAPFVAPINLNL